MSISASSGLRTALAWSPLWLLFLLGMWLVVLRPMGPGLSLVPGDLGDARFNNYVLEHFLRWLSGSVRGYWNAPFFYPFPLVTAFSDNLLGSAPFYAMFRFMGLDRATAFQAWYVFGCVLNFSAAAWVLWRFRLHPLAVGAGSFFFAFGLPLLAQENHAQLLYHFCVPLAGYALWRLFHRPRLVYLVALVALSVWQFYLTIYMGMFLMLLLGVMFVLMPFFSPARTFRHRLLLWPRGLMRAWRRSTLAERLLALAGIAMLGLAFGGLIYPYYRASHMYGFSRNLLEVLIMLPRLNNYLLADNSQLWGFTANIAPTIPLRWERQLFPGLGVVLLLLVGIAWRFKIPNRRLAWLHFAVAFCMIGLTLAYRGLSFYILLYLLPGMNSIRAVPRYFLVVMWPLALFAAWVIDGLMRRLSHPLRWLQVVPILLVVLLVAESVFYNHGTYDKATAQQRLDELAQKLPASLPANPVLYVATKPDEPAYAREIDGMLLAQNLGWPTLNGYSGNYPPGNSNSALCQAIPDHIKNYMEYAGITDPAFYLDMIQRVVPIDFVGCDPAWWQTMP